MEFHEKLQELRKSRGLTQEELAEALYVSRTAISKWESGRGYPSIDSLKEISSYFSVTIDDLLSGEKLLSIAERENKANMQHICGLLLGIIDICTFLLIVLPLYPNTVDGHIYSVNLFSYVETTAFNRLVYWVVFVSLIVVGVIGVLLTTFRPGRNYKVVTGVSMGLSIMLVLILAMSREAYAIMVVFLLLVIKAIVLLRQKM